MTSPILNDVLKLYIMGSEELELTLHAPYLQVLGNAFDTRIVGNALDNTLDGGAGTDTLVGGAGNDVYGVDSSTDVVSELAGEGTDTVIASASFVLSSNIENLTLIGTGAINGSGNDLSNAIIGNDGANVLFGFKGDDTIKAGAGADNLSGGDGNDILDGGLGIDIMAGGTGDDIYYVDDTADSVFEGENEGIDTVIADRTFTLSAYVENLVLTGEGDCNGTGNILDNKLTGSDGNNALDGGDGNDRLNGGLGLDMLTGGAGKDIFVFDTKPSATNVDVINDFNPAEDKIYLENAIFRKLTKAGKLKTDFFTISAKAKDANDFIGYNKSTGELWYDSNGKAAGGHVKIAMLDKGLAMSASKFFVI